MPDFGFDDLFSTSLNQRTDVKSFWQLLFEQIENNAKYERLRTYIEHVNEKKLEKIAAMARLQPQKQESLQRFLTMLKQNKHIVGKFGKCNTNQSTIGDDERMIIFEYLYRNKQMEEVNDYNPSKAKKDEEETKAKRTKLLAEIDRVRNPITGEYGQRCSSQAIKEAWVQLQELKKEVKTNIRALINTQYNFSLDFVEHMIDILE